MDGYWLRKHRFEDLILPQQRLIHIRLFCKLRYFEDIVKLWIFRLRMIHNFFQVWVTVEFLWLVGVVVFTVNSMPNPTILLHPQPQHNTTTTQPQHCILVGHENDCAYPTPPTTKTQEPQINIYWPVRTSRATTTTLITATTTTISTRTRTIFQGILKGVSLEF